ncbi:MAG: isoprenylcysteine carboxylmethyltransferase family protein [Patescibacteria group bacterium]|nr:isoprenylcysteine carboxylmethyltransferase family protein [Patescibacteria group bacterium]
MLQQILLACWLIFVFYWFVSSWFVKPTQEAVWDFSKFRLIIILAVIVLLILGRTGLFSAYHIGFCVINWRSCHYSLFVVSPIASPTVQFLGVVLTVIGLCIAVIARKILAGNWSGSIEHKKWHELITSGIYGYVRHPIYTGVLLMSLGSVLYLQTPVLFILFFVLVFFVVYKLKKEEELMVKHFPKEYLAYKKRVKMLIPFVI